MTAAQPSYSDLVKQLRTEADATEELHPEDSQIEVMRNAAIAIEQLELDNGRLRSGIRELRGKLNELVDKVGGLS